MVAPSSFEPSIDDGRYRLLVESISDYAIYMLDVDGRVTSWNPGAQRFKGYAAHEIIGQHFSRFYTEAERAAGVPANALNTAATEGRFEREGWRIRKDGSRFWAHVIIDPIRAPSGDLIGFAKITRDLTERKKAEETLRRSEEQFRLLVQGVTDYAIYMLDPEGRVSSWNAGAERIKGYTAEEIVGEHFSRFYTADDREADRPGKALQTARAEGRFESEGWRLRKDGSRFWAHVIIDVIRDDFGDPIGFAKITRDITERAEAQRALAETREALLQSQKLDAIGQLTGGVAHDFNNLLMAVLGSLELLRRHLPVDSQRAFALLDNAVQGAKRGAALTQRMLAFARKQELRLEPVDVHALVLNMMGLLQRSVGPTTQISVEIETALPPVLTDPNQLESALLNLAVNARDAMPSGGRISIRARRHTVQTQEAGGLSPGDYVGLSVVDDGEGMDVETLARAREPFFTTKGVGKGTGLGLSMVHGLAAQSGGQLTISSEAGNGACVEIYLPVTQGMVAGHGPAPDDQISHAPHGSLVVLAVDDDALVLMNTTAMLEDLGHTVLAAASANEALSLMGERPVELVLTDYAMPGKTGLELAKDVRAGWPDVAVILTSGYADMPDGGGMETGRLPKPFTQADLARALGDALRSRETKPA